ncbi:MAG: transposase [Nitrospira sp.]|nr:transposase [Nitrospira sp.]
MARPSYTKGQMKVALSKLSAGRSVSDVSREDGIPQRTLYRWRARLTMSPRPTTEQLRVLEAEHRRLQRQFAELALDHSTLRAALLKDVKGEC